MDLGLNGKMNLPGLFSFSFHHTFSSVTAILKNFSCNFKGFVSNC